MLNKRVISIRIALLLLSCCFQVPGSAAQDLTKDRTYKLWMPPGSTYSFGWSITEKKCLIGSFIEATTSAYEGYSLCPGAEFVPIVFPGTSSFTQANGMNDAGTIVGDFIGADQLTHGFLLSNGNYVEYDAAPGPSTYITRINNARHFIGYVGADQTSFEGFIDLGGNVTTFAFNGYWTYPFGMNNKDEVVGMFLLPPPIGTAHCFYRSAHGRMHRLDYPGATQTVCLGINDDGLIVGYYLDQQSLPHGFGYKHGTYQTLPVPTVAGINDEGDFVGFYVASNGKTYSYVSWHH